MKRKFRFGSVFRGYYYPTRHVLGRGRIVSTLNAIRLTWRLWRDQ